MLENEIFVSIIYIYAYNICAVKMTVITYAIILNLAYA